MKYEEKPRQLPDGRYYVKVSDEEGGRVFVQLNGVSVASSLWGQTEVTLGLSDGAQDKVSGLDAQNIEAAKTHCTGWFGKELNEKTLTTAYAKSLVDGGMDVSKIVIKDQVYTKVYDHTKTEITDPELCENTPCDVILELSGLWFMKKTYGAVWRLVQVKLKAPPKKKKYVDDVYMFQDEPEPVSDGDEDFF